MKAMRAIALKLPDVEEGVACEGTALEKRTVKVKGKAFLFLGTGDALLKLDGSLAAATKLADKTPARYRVGKGGLGEDRLQRRRRAARGRPDEMDRREPLPRQRPQKAAAEEASAVEIARTFSAVEIAPHLG